MKLQLRAIEKFYTVGKNTETKALRIRKETNFYVGSIFRSGMKIWAEFAG